MKNKTVSTLVVTSALALSTLFSTMNVSADSFNYTYAEAGLSKIDRNTASGEGYSVGGSYDVAPNINLLGSVTNTDLETSGVEDTFNTYQLGVGYHTQVAEKTDATAHISAIKTESIDDTGFGLGVGLRHLFTEQIEGDAAIDYVDINDQTDTAVSVGGRYYFSNNVSAGLGYSKTNKTDTDTWAGTLRMSFL